ncbi:MAG: hypothetical protein ACR2JE_14475 [Acidobacteriaceae bacterium]
MSVQSNGADLAEVLGAVQQATGFKISGVAAAQKQKLVGEFGPGDPAAVLAELLDGKRLNYIILKSQSDPKVIRSVMLFAQSAPATQLPAQPLTAPAPAAPRAVPAPPPPAPENRPRNPQAGEAPPRTEPPPQAEQPAPDSTPTSADDQPRASH